MSNSSRPPNPCTLSALEADCRKLLGKLAHRGNAREFAWARDVVETLEELDLVTRTAAYANGEGSYQATSRAAGYCATPNTFEL